eukprot:scaffold16769_cov53-Phaeocystis_antarctica.AAC.2
MESNALRLSRLVNQQSLSSRPDAPGAVLAALIGARIAAICFCCPPSGLAASVELVGEQAVEIVVRHAQAASDSGDQRNRCREPT